MSAARMTPSGAGPKVARDTISRGAEQSPHRGSRIRKERAA